MRKLSIKSLRRKLKRIFSEYIRRQYTHCVTCGKPLHWKQGHAGHYIEVGSATQGTEYEERNVHLQCPYCNTFCEGKKAEYTLFMINKYGPGIVEELVKQSKWSLLKFVEKLTGCGFDMPQEAYQHLIIYFTKKLESLK